MQQIDRFIYILNKDKVKTPLKPKKVSQKDKKEKDKTTKNVSGSDGILYTVELISVFS